MFHFRHCGTTPYINNIFNYTTHTPFRLNIFAAYKFIDFIYFENLRLYN